MNAHKNMQLVEQGKIMATKKAKKKAQVADAGRKSE